VQRASAQEVADIGHDPFGTGFDEEVVIEVGDVVFDDTSLLGNDAEQRSEHVTVLGIAATINRWQQGIQMIGGGMGHGCISVRLMPSGLRIRRSAGLICAGVTDSSRRALCANRIAFNV